MCAEFGLLKPADRSDVRRKACGRIEPEEGREAYRGSEGGSQDLLEDRPGVTSGRRRSGRRNGLESRLVTEPVASLEPTGSAVKLGLSDTAPTSAGSGSCWRSPEELDGFGPKVTRGCVASGIARV